MRLASQRVSSPLPRCSRTQFAFATSSTRSFTTSTPLRDAARPTVLTASRTLDYPAYAIFKVIADINSYPKFLPYVRGAHILSNSPRPDSYHKEHWPALANLTVGFQDNVSETYTSRVYCVPPTPRKGRAGVGFIEAISGSEAPRPTFTTEDDVSHYDDIENTNLEETTEGPLAHLRTRWTVGGYPHKPAPGGAEGTHDANIEQHTSAEEKTDVSLAVEYRFKSPVYDILSQAASYKVADMMIEAFEKRLKEVLGKQA